MQFLRSFLTGGRFYILPYQSLKISTPELGDFQNYFISLVPTQLQFLLDAYPQWLAGFQTVLLGGAPAEKSLLEKARKFSINLSPTYGMTETASQIATLKSEDFLQGNDSNGRVLPHANITIKDQQIIISSKSLFLGYYPQLLNQSTELITDDLGYFNEDGYLYILGRRSQVIITGGEKVFPQEVESTLLETELFKDVVIMGLPDTYWGQIVVGVYVPKYPELSLGDIQRAMGNKLAKFKQPKYWIKLDSIPRNQQGKINYKQLRKTAQSLYAN
jgi:O-succinylbenzoic acid--CoA ligase